MHYNPILLIEADNKEDAIEWANTFIEDTIDTGTSFDYGKVLEEDNKDDMSIVKDLGLKHVATPLKDAIDKIKIIETEFKNGLRKEIKEITETLPNKITYETIYANQDLFWRLGKLINLTLGDPFHHELPTFNLKFSEAYSDSANLENTWAVVIDVHV